MGDPRVSDWPLMSSPLPTASLALSYVAACVLARRADADRKPMLPDVIVKPVLVIYNVANILLNAYIARELFVGSVGYR